MQLTTVSRRSVIVNASAHQTKKPVSPVCASKRNIMIGLTGAVAALTLPTKAFAAQQFDENMESMRSPVNKKRALPVVGSSDDQQDVLDTIIDDGDMQLEGRRGRGGT